MMTNTTPAPVLIFVYKRLGPLKQTIERLKENVLAKESTVYIFSDGPKKEADAEEINRVRDYIKTIDGFGKVIIMESPTNRGLATSIISGVNYVFQTHPSLIVLEDDLLTTTNFLSFMNDSLDRYRSERKVFSISGYSFDLAPSLTYQKDAYFLNRGWSWGWATWKDRWDAVDWSVSDYQEFSKSRSRKRQFSKGGSDLNKMLQKQMENKIDSWAIRWFYHQFKVGGLTLYPTRSKIWNNGFDDLATHTQGSQKRYIPNLDDSGELKFRFPDKIEITQEFQKAFQQKMGIAARIKSKIETILKSLTHA